MRLVLDSRLAVVSGLFGGRFFGDWRSVVTEVRENAWNGDSRNSGDFLFARSNGLVENNAWF